MPTIQRLRDLSKRKEIPNQYLKYYNTKTWKVLRDNQLHNHPLCERCLEKGITKQAECVHHRIPFSQGITEAQRWELFSDPNALQSLCNECHREIHKELKNKK